jgi:hypothetical protein
MSISSKPSILAEMGGHGCYLECVRERIKPHLCDATGKWTADYVRLRFAAHLTH